MGEMAGMVVIGRIWVSGDGDFARCRRSHWSFGHCPAKPVLVQLKKHPKFLAKRGGLCEVCTFVSYSGSASPSCVSRLWQQECHKRHAFAVARQLRGRKRRKRERWKRERRKRQRQRCRGRATSGGSEADCDTGGESGDPPAKAAARRPPAPRKAKHFSSP